MKTSFLFLIVLIVCVFGSASACGSSDLQQICQLTIDMRDLDKYFHVDKLPDRKPLLVIKNQYTAGEPALFKFGEKVRYVLPNEMRLKPRPYFEFSKIQITGNSAYVEFVYPPEGLAGKVDLLKDERGWHTKSHSIVER